MNLRLTGVFILMILAANQVFAQQKIDQISPEIFLEIVKNNHPISVQSKLLNKIAAEEVTKSKGSLDPYLFSNYDQKYYGNKEYFNLFDGGLVIPTWYGVEFKAAYTDNSGINLNPENYVDNQGMWYAGIKVPLGNGLAIDKRRADIRKARLLVEASDWEQKILLSDLYYNGLKEYWDWVESYNSMLVYKEASVLAKERFEAVKNNFLAGENPAIDTIEAVIQFQSRQIQLNDAVLDFRYKTQELSNFLWLENQIPVEISDSVKAPILSINQQFEAFPIDSLYALNTRIEEINPQVQLYNNKLQGAQISKDLSREALKPKFNVNYNLLSKRNNGNLVLNTQNYKWGFEFSIPIFLRQARGSIKIAQFQIQDVQLEKQQKITEIKNKIKNQFNKQENIISQIKLYASTVDAYNSLLTGEKEKFELGESSLFLINSRENKLIEAKIKLLSLIKYYKMSNVEILQSVGILYQI